MINSKRWWLFLTSEALKHNLFANTTGSAIFFTMLAIFTVLTSPATFTTGTGSHCFGWGRVANSTKQDG